MPLVRDTPEPDMPDPPLSPDDLDERRVEAQVEELFHRFVNKTQPDRDPDNSADIDPDTSDLPAGHLRCGDLPEILREFEAMRTERQKLGGEEDVDVTPLLHPNLLPQIETFAAQNASVGIEPHQLVEMILGLQRAFDQETVGSRPASPPSSLSDEMDEVAPTAPALHDAPPYDSDGDGAFTDEERMRQHRALASSPPPESEGECESTSDASDEIGLDYSASQSLVQSRPHGLSGLSASTPARRSSLLRSSSPRHRRHMPGVLESGGGGGKSSTGPGEDVLLGHGKAKAPPTSWTRPRTSRRGRSSDVMPASSELSEAESVSHIRRSSHHASSDHATRPFSPELEDGRAMALSAMALSYAEASFAGNTSGTAELLRENERLARARQTLERTLETKEDEHEAQVAELHAQLEAAEDNLASKKREEREAVLRAAHVADQVASLEAELSNLARRNADLEEIHAKGREQVEDLMVETENLRRQRDELRNQLTGLKESEEHERDQSEMAQAEVARLKHALAEKEQRVEQLIGLQSENEKLAQDMLALRTTVSKLKDELEERARAATASGSFGQASGAKGLPSLVGAPSRRLGAELARELDQDASEGSETESNASEAGAGEAGSGDNSFVEHITRRYKRRSKSRAATVYAEVGTQTDLASKQAEPAGDASDREPPPPTYDEAALERAIVERLHPHSLPSTLGDGSHPSLSKWSEYVEMSHQLGLRCTLLEERMQALIPSPPLGGKRTQCLSYAQRGQMFIAQLLKLLGDLGQGRAPENHQVKPVRFGLHVGWAVLVSVFLLGMLVAHLSFSSDTVQIGPFSSSGTDFAAAHALFAPAGATHMVSYELPDRHWLGTGKSLRNYRGTAVPF